ncbi:NAD(P)H-dependent oxidoreductase [archaeon]|nr:NAD(P)H-dependent oxidoreductase [archaeon]
MEFKEIVETRYATKRFDGQVLSGEKIDQLLEIIRMSASSFGLQPYVIKIVTDDAVKKELMPASFGQEQITTCSHLLVFCANLDVKGRIDEYAKLMGKSGVPQENIMPYIDVMKKFEAGLDEQGKLSWAQRQTYIAVGNAINGAKSLGFDSCPMEGFDPKAYSEILKLPENLIPSVLVTVGYAADEPKPKLRYPKHVLFQA